MSHVHLDDLNVLVWYNFHFPFPEGPGPDFLLLLLDLPENSFTTNRVPMTLVTPTDTTRVKLLRISSIFRCKEYAGRICVQLDFTKQKNLCIFSLLAMHSFFKETFFKVQVEFTWFAEHLPYAELKSFEA